MSSLISLKTISGTGFSFFIKTKIKKKRNRIKRIAEIETNKKQFIHPNSANNESRLGNDKTVHKVLYFNQLFIES